ncbi:MAG: hypothetical protein NVSMB9_00750 [Isosphaeraceae bacterium]
MAIGLNTNNSNLLTSSAKCILARVVGALPLWLGVEDKVAENFVPLGMFVGLSIAPSRKKG